MALGRKAVAQVVRSKGFQSQSTIQSTIIELCCKPNKCTLPPLHLVDSTSCIYDCSSRPIVSKMSTSNTAPSPIQGVCYFSIQHTNYSSYNDETPLTTPFTPPGENIVSDPSNPLLAYRPCLQSPSTTQTRSGMESLLQLQTQVAHISAPRRPQPQPLQNVLVVSDDLSESDSSSSSQGHMHMEVARCSRCHRSQSIDVSTGKAANMVAYGLNSFYCLRCANITGYLQRS